MPEAPRLFTFGCVGGRIQATSAAPLWSSTQNYKNAKCSFFLKKMNNQSQRNHRRGKADLKRNHRIISKLIRSYKCEKENFNAVHLEQEKNELAGCALSKAKLDYLAQHYSPFCSTACLTSMTFTALMK